MFCTQILALSQPAWKFPVGVNRSKHVFVRLTFYRLATNQFFYRVNPKPEKASLSLD